MKCPIQDVPFNHQMLGKDQAMFRRATQSKPREIWGRETPNNRNMCGYPFCCCHRSLVHGILLDQPVGVAIDACVRIVQIVGRGLSSLCSTLRTKYICNILEVIPLRPHVIVALLASRFTFSPLLFMMHLLLVEVSSEGK